MPPTALSRPLRLFLDTGVLVQGHFGGYASGHAVLILCTQRTRFQALIAEPVAEGFARWLRAKTGGAGEPCGPPLGVALPTNEAARLTAGVDGRHARARPARAPWPSAQELARHVHLLAAVRQANDMPAVVAAVPAQPDWVLSTNTKHWNHAPADRTGLRVAHPAAFLARLHP